MCNKIQELEAKITALRESYKFYNSSGMLVAIFVPEDKYIEWRTPLVSKETMVLFAAWYKKQLKRKV